MVNNDQKTLFLPVAAVEAMMHKQAITAAVVAAAAMTFFVWSLS